MSDCNKVTIPARTAINNTTHKFNILTITSLLKRKIPKPPNLSNKPANTIEPLVLASTWALGNQVWRPNTGIFTKKGNIKIIK